MNMELRCDRCGSVRCERAWTRKSRIPDGRIPRRASRWAPSARSVGKWGDARRRFHRRLAAALDGLCDPPKAERRRDVRTVLFWGESARSALLRRLTPRLIKSIAHRLESTLELDVLRVELVLRFVQQSLEALDSLVPGNELALCDRNVLLKRRVLLDELQSTVSEAEGEKRNVPASGRA